MKSMAIAAAALLAASLASADATVQQKTQVRFGGAMGGVINAFGRGATHEGLTSDTFVHRNRKSTRTGDRGEIIDLDEEKVYQLDYGRKTYKVVTFAELRKQYEESKERSEKREARSESRSESKEGPEYEVEFSTKSTGNHETINGWNTHEEIVTITVHEKGKKIEQSGGFILTSDMWMGPRLPAMHELTDFDLRYMRKLYGQSFGIEMQTAAAMMATNPAFGKAMKAFGEKRSNFEGTPIRTKMTFESVAGTEPQADQQPEPQPGGLMGGLMGRMQRKREPSSEPGRSVLFESNSEVLKASSSASAADVAIPAGFTER